MKIKTEDWLSLITGFGVVILALVGFSLPGLKLNPDTLNLKTLSVLLQYLVIVLAVSGVLFWLHSHRNLNFFIVIILVFALALGSIFISSIRFFKNIGFEYVIFSLLFGIAIRSTVKIPDFVSQNSFSEFFVKVGLVILGSSVIFGDILKAGTLGLVQALVVVLAVWYFAFWLGSKLKIDEELKVMLASAVSICGVSAAIATAGAIKGDSKKLSYVVSLVLIVALPMLIFQPLVAKALGLSPQVAGAWLGGTIDTTGAVVASGELLGDEALKYSTIVKFSQNILLGLAALAISIFWSLRSVEPSEKVSVGILWERFPKFVLGFVAVSLLYSFAVPADTVTSTKDFLKSFQTVLFAIAFVFIGLETDFKSLFSTGQGKPALVFVGAQVFNILFTLAVSYFLFR